jgi:hypothetical protein
MSTWIDQQEQSDPNKITTALTAYRAHRAGKFARVADQDGGDERFGLWLALVDNRITRAVGVGLFDLADWPIRDSYESGDSPTEAALIALESDDTYAALVSGSFDGDF